MHRSRMIWWRCQGLCVKANTALEAEGQGLDPGLEAQSQGEDPGLDLQDRGQDQGLGLCV